MKKLVLIQLLVFLICNSSYSQKYFGKSYTQTQSVHEYFDELDVKKSYTVMGTAELDQGFRSLEKCQQKLVDLAKKKGADGIIFVLEEEVYGSSTSGGATVNEKKNNKTRATTSSATVDLKKKTIKAKLIKYE
jgi:hypothetical protein